MISVAEALERILSLVAFTEEETVPLHAAPGRVLARPLAALRTQPPFAASAMDGYAVRSGDATSGAVLTVVGEAQAGGCHDGVVGLGEAVRIFTGAPVPEGADRVVIQEDVARDGDRITLGDRLDEKTHIRPAGGDFHEGDEVPLQRITPALVSLLAAMNHAEVPVRRRPVVALIATGDELVVPGESPGPNQIVSSNIYGVAALLEAHGALTRILPIARDTRESLEQSLELAEGADLIVTLGGASVGDHDLVAEVAGTRGLALDFYKVRMRPGKPLMAGRLGDAAMVGLPGNPVSAFVCAHLFLRPAIDTALGLPAGPLPRRALPLAHDLAANGNREHYMRAHLRDDGTVEVATRQDSSLLTVLAAADVLAVRPPDDPPRNAGDPVEIVTL